MSCAVMFVLLGSNLVSSLLRHRLRPHVRILIFTLTISAFVTMADLFLSAKLPDMSRALGPYVPLIIVNCIIIARAESCASKNGLWQSLWDAIGMGLGFGWAICTLGAVRELLATGNILGFTVFGTWFEPWAIMGMAPGAFLGLGIMIGIGNWIQQRRIKAA
jgi:electron transport complex protein RnfE